MTSQENSDVCPFVLPSGVELCLAQVGKYAETCGESVWRVQSVEGMKWLRQCETLNPLFSRTTEEELLIFDLQSLATLAAARALEMGSQEGGSAAPGRCFPARRALNLRRKFNWTPRNEPVNKRFRR